MTRSVQFRYDTLTPLQDIALHEAAHAVIGWRCGLPIDYVTIVPEPGEYDGIVWWQCRMRAPVSFPIGQDLNPFAPWTREYWGAQLYMAAAPHGLPFHAFGTSTCLSDSDWEVIEKARQHVPIDEDKLFCNMDRLVQTELETIFVVARSLMRHKQLTGHQVGRIIGRVDRDSVAPHRTYHALRGNDSG
ncbi:hypothetical protein AB8Z38_22905 [Bradyrhizobium sp. LLZ17]|uniref:Peptidase M41 domain-containing protein n=1 Tax=Bradyrhizobium sp. LLZ17 TaxID=3239388 RepID=A0AB39XDJ7_9BRAD